MAEQPQGGGQPPLLAGLQLVQLGHVVQNVAEQAHAELRQLAETLPGRPDEERKRALLRHLHGVRQRLQRLHVLAAWPGGKAGAVAECRGVMAAAAGHAAALRDTADQLAYLHGELMDVQAPAHDVATALRILRTGRYALLPSVIEDGLQLGERRQRAAGEREAALRCLDFLMRAKLMAEGPLPAGMRVVRVGGGVAVVGCPGRYTARLTLVPAPRDDVTLAKYRPPADEDDTGTAGDTGTGTAVPREEPEVVGPVAGGGAAPGSNATGEKPEPMDAEGGEAGPSSAAAAAAAAGDEAGPAADAGATQATSRWRWRLLGLSLLPELGARDPPAVPSRQEALLQAELEARMWAAADVQQLGRLGQARLVALPAAPAPLPVAAARRRGKQGSGAGTSSRGAASLSTGPEPAAGGAASSQQQAGPSTAGDGGEPGGTAAPAEEELPAWARDPLVALHSVLAEAAGRVALYGVLLPEARRLEAGGGAWAAGGAKLERAAEGPGIRLSYWRHLPSLGQAELRRLRGEEAPPAAPAPAPAPAPAAQQAPAIEVALSESGELSVAAHPPLCDPHSGAPVHLTLGPDLSLERLLASAAAHHAATQLAAVLAVLRQDARLAAAGVTAQLVLPPPAAPPAKDGAATPPEQPVLQLWSGSDVWATLTLHPTSGRAQLAAGASVLEEGEIADVAASLSEAARRQAELLQADAPRRPLPAGGTAALLAAQLVAGVAANLCLRLASQAQMAAVAAAAAPLGLLRSALPLQLVQAYFEGLPPAMGAPSQDCVALALPQLRAPPDMCRLAAGDGSQGCGAVSLFILADCGYNSRGAVVEEGSAAQRQPRLSLAVCKATSRGVATQVTKAIPIPSMTLAQQATNGSTATQPAGRAAPPVAGSKRRRSSRGAAEERPQADEPMANGEDGAAAAAAPAGPGPSLEAQLAAALAWCRGRVTWETLLEQLSHLGLPFWEDWQLGGGGAAGRVARLPRLPGLAALDRWAAARQAALPESLSQPGHWPAAPSVTLGPVPGDGERCPWQAEVRSLYLAALPHLCGSVYGAPLAAPRPGDPAASPRADGLTLSYELQKGGSAFSAVVDVMRAVRLHTFLARLATFAAADPLAQRVHSAGASAGSGRGGTREKKAAAPRQQASGGAAICWTTPGTGTVVVAEVGLLHAVLSVSAAPSGSEAAAAAGGRPPVRVTLDWEPTYSSAGAPLVRCRLEAQPTLPPLLAAALAALAEGGCEQEFMDSLCLAAHPTGVAQRELAPERLRAAGLAPGAAALRSVPAGGQPEPGAAAGASTASAVRARLEVRQGARALDALLLFARGGLTLLRLLPVPAATGGVPPEWLAQLLRGIQALPGWHPVPGPALAPGALPPGPEKPRHAAWLSLEALGPALEATLRAVAGSSDEGPAPGPPEALAPPLPS